MTELLSPFASGLLKASYSTSREKSSESGSNRLQKLYFSQRSIVGSDSILTVGIVEYRGNDTWMIFQEKIKRQVLGRFSNVTDARKIESFSGRSRRWERWECNGVF